MIFNVGDRITNTKNNSLGEIKSIKNNVATIICYEEIHGLFKNTGELVTEIATRTIHLKLLKKCIDDGLFKINE